MDINFDPAWPAEQRLEVIKHLAYRMHCPPLLPIAQFIERAEVIQFVASLSPQFLENNIAAIRRALER